MEVPETNGDKAKNEKPEPPTLLGRRRIRRRSGAAGARLGEIHGVDLAHTFAPVVYHGCASESVPERTIAN